MSNNVIPCHFKVNWSFERLQPNLLMKEALEQASIPQFPESAKINAQRELQRMEDDACNMRDFLCRVLDRLKKLHDGDWTDKQEGQYLACAVMGVFDPQYDSTECGIRGAISTLQRIVSLWRAYAIEIWVAFDDASFDVQFLSPDNDTAFDMVMSKYLEQREDVEPLRWSILDVKMMTDSGNAFSVMDEFSAFSGELVENST